MKRFFTAAMCLLLAVFAFNAPALANGSAYLPPDLENLVVFGDSLSDSGNIYNLTAGASPDSEEYWEGRFSNGPVWAEVMADFMGADNAYLLSNEPEMEPSGKFLVVENPPISSYATPFFYNNAFGGANTGANFTHFGWQIDVWQYMGLAIPEKSLVVVWIGGNDFLGMSEGSDPGTEVAVAVGNIYAGLADIVGLGATHIAVCNLPNLGDTPRYYGTDLEDDVAALTIGFNTALADALQYFMAHFPAVTVYPVDVYAMGEQTHANPALYGITNLYEAALLQGEDFDTADGYLYWDGVHPTKTAHEQIGALVYGTVFMGEGNANYVKTKGTTGDVLGIEGDNCDVTSLQFADETETAKTDRPSNLLYGLLDITATMNVAGDVAQITLYLPNALPNGYSWYKHIQGDWVDFAQVFRNTAGAEGAQISADRKQVTLYILDNGQYDADATLGVVRDPIGAGVLLSDKPEDAGDDDQCFVRSVGGGSASAMPLVLLGAFLALGFAVRRMR